MQEATAMPTVPQTLPMQWSLFANDNNKGLLGTVTWRRALRYNDLTKPLKSKSFYYSNVGLNNISATFDYPGQEDDKKRWMMKVQK